MARGKTGARRGRSASVTDGAQGGVQLCGSCSKDVGDDSFGCDKCESWVHATEMCSGLPQYMIDSISKYGGAGIQFICIACRLTHTSGRANSPSSSKETHMTELVGQLFQQVKGMCTVIKNLTDKVEALSNTPKPPDPGAPSPPQRPSEPGSQHGSNTQPAGYRDVIREELRELREREKRQKSVILKGLKAQSPTELSNQFLNLTQECMGLSVVLSDITPIRGSTELFRAKILNDDHRKAVLEKARTLKDTRFGNVFISRDLTYAQRSELYARRQARKVQGSAETRVDGNTPPVMPGAEPGSQNQEN